MICAIDWAKQGGDKTVMMFVKRDGDKLIAVKEITLDFVETAALRQAMKYE